MECPACLFLVLVGVLGSYAVNPHTNTTIDTYNMLELCGQTINLKWKSIYTAEITFNFDPEDIQPFLQHATRVNDNYSLPVLCELSVESWTFLDRLMVVINELELRTDCGDTFLEILDGIGPEAPPLKGLPPSLCRHHRDRVLSVPYQTSNKFLSIRVHGNPGRKHSLQFAMTVVAFHEGDCRSYEYACASGRCIMDDIVCNGHNPCGDNSDCLTKTDSPREVTVDDDDVLIPVLAALSVAIIAVPAGTIIFCRCYRKRQKQLRHQEYLSTYSPNRPNVNISVSPSYQLERTVSQIEAEQQLAPPSYSSLPENQMEDRERPSGHEEPTLDECLEIDEHNPPSYACVMTYKDEFKLSDLSIHRAGQS